jgi:multimeric flavodoxin WrbA
MKEKKEMINPTTKAIILDGSREDDREARLASEAVRAEMTRKAIEFSYYVLRDIKIAPCTGCLKCWTKTPGECTINDEQRKIYTDAGRADMLVLITPVTFGGYSSELKKGMDRLIPALLPFFRTYDGETHHPMRYGNGWDLFAVGTLGEHNEDREGLFRELVIRNSLNMHANRTACGIVVKGTDEKDINIRVTDELRKVIA